MLRLAVIAAIGVLSAAGAAKVLTIQAAHGAETAGLRGPEASDAPPAVELAGGPPTDAEAPKGPDGHYWAEGQVDGARVRLLVDTGATTVALTPADAQRLGFDPQSLAYNLPVRTANGEGRAARIRLSSLSIGGARVEDVEAMVVQQGLPTSLLGMSYLGRLSRFEATPQALILRP